MALPQEHENFTYADYLHRGEEERYEVINGKIYNMSPSPTPIHQEVVTQLVVEFGNYLRGKACRVFASPIDVCLSDEKVDLKKVKEWVQPDLVVVCDKSKIDEKRIVGTPDLVVEVLSPSTAKKDKLVKFNRYQKAGVKEYWIVDPVHQTIEIYLLEGTTFKHSGTYFKDDTISVNLFNDFSIELNNVFRDEE